MALRTFSPLLELDPSFGDLLDATRRQAAQRDLFVAEQDLPVGPWDLRALTEASPTHIGLLVVDGVIAREVLVGDVVSTELLGPGDLVRPWQLGDVGPLLDHQVRWEVLAPCRVAILDRRLTVALGRYPEVTAAVIDRVNERASRLSVTQAICHMHRVDRRLLALFWHLAERWGRVTEDGVAVPMRLPHRMLGQLVGARRPTVSVALRDLAERGLLTRRADGTWLLPGDPVDGPSTGRLVRLRQGLLAAEETPAPLPALTRPDRPRAPRHPAGGRRAGRRARPAPPRADTR